RLHPEADRVFVLSDRSCGFHNVVSAGISKANGIAKSPWHKALVARVEVDECGVVSAPNVRGGATGRFIERPAMCDAAENVAVGIVGQYVNVDTYERHIPVDADGIRDLDLELSLQGAETLPHRSEGDVLHQRLCGR